MFRKNNKKYSEQSSESDVSSQNQQPSPQKLSKQPMELSEDQQNQSGSESEENNDSLQKTNLNRKMNMRGAQQQEDQHSSEEEDSSEQGEDVYMRKLQSKNGIHTIKQDPSESIDDDNIDIIEQRIKKLEKDLQTRLNKHKEKQEINKKQQSGKIVTKTTANPPIPKKSSPSSQEMQNKMGVMNFGTNNNKSEELLQKKPQIKKPIISTNPIPATKPKREMKKQPNPELKQQTKIQPKLQQKQHKTKFKPRKETFHKQQQKANDQRIQEMQRIIKELRLQNQVLKQKLQSEKGKKTRPRNKTVEELEKIRDSSSIHQKLQKQIQLLQVIEKLQAKLKKSISKKLAKQGSVATSLLHKGLPTSLQSNY